MAAQVLGDGGELFSDIFSYRFLDRFCDGFGSPDGAKMLPKSVKNRVQEGTWSRHSFWIDFGFDSGMEKVGFDMVFHMSSSNSACPKRVLKRTAKTIQKASTNWLKSQKNAIRKHIPKRIPKMYDFVVEMAPRTERLGPSKIMKNRLGDQRCSKEAFGCHLDTILVWFWGAISTCFRCVLHHIVIMCAGLPSQCLLLGLSLKTHCWKRIGWLWMNSVDHVCWFCRAHLFGFGKLSCEVVSPSCLCC